MKTITAVIRCKPGTEEIMKKGLLDVAANVRDNEPGTIDFFLSQDPNDNLVFTTYERFADQAAMDTHNNSATVAAFFEVAKPILDGDVTLLICDEFSSKNT